MLKGIWKKTKIKYPPHKQTSIYLFFFLCVLFVLLRLYPIWPSNFPFNYDNAKDSLVIMQMWVHHKPALLGAVTSMEGLYQGPFWYYVFLPINILLSFHPIASVYTVIFVGIITLWFVYRYLGKLEAFLFTTSSLVVPTHQTAWSPYLTIFSVFWVFIILKLLKSKKSLMNFFLLGASLSTLFHSQIAFAAVFVPTSAIVIYRRKLVKTTKQLASLLTGFISLFVFHLVFEFRHNFIQTKSVIRFVTNFSSESAGVQGNTSGLMRLKEVVDIFLDTAVGSISPVRLEYSFWIFSFLVISGLVVYLKGKKKWDILAFIMLPFILYLLLPVKAFYLVGLAPVWIIIFSKIMNKRTPLFRIFIIFLFSILAIVNMFQQRERYSELEDNSLILYSSREQAVKKVYELSGGKQFSSYHYVPELYDFTYQHIYQFYSYIYGYRLPVDYSYEPGVPDYMQTIKLESDGTEQYRMLIVENDERPEFFPTWWNNLTRGWTVESSVQISEDIKVYRLVK